MTPNAESLTIVITGIRNAGKSSLINGIFEKDIAIVSDYAGTTTDPVVRKIELSELGSCTVVDTAGIDDEGEIGLKRVEKSMEYLKKAHLIIFTTPIDKNPSNAEIEFYNKLKGMNVPCLTAATHSGNTAVQSKIEWLNGMEFVKVDSLSGEGLADLRKKIISFKSLMEYEITPLEGIVKEGDSILLVTPIDLAAPKGRLILPQVEVIRDALDRDCSVMIVKERELYSFYNNLSRKPDLVITDSQVFSKAAADIDPDQKLTSFSIIFARKKGELDVFLEGIEHLKNIKDQSKILIMESCSHHRQADDIGTVKIPRLFKQLVNPHVSFEFTRELPADIEKYDLVIHCAACMNTRKDMTAKLSDIKKAGVPVTNYGLFLGWANGLIPRALEVLGGECVNLQKK